MTNEPVSGFVDPEGRLVAADPQLLALQERAGGGIGDVVAIPQIASLARLAQRLGILISRGVIASDGAQTLDLWVRAQPEPAGVRLTIGGWTIHQRRSPSDAEADQRALDFLRAGSDWLWECDAELRIVSIAAAPGQPVDMAPHGLIGQPITRLFRLLEDDAGDLPLLVAVAGRRRFSGQVARLRIPGGPCVEIAGVPLTGRNGEFAGFRGSVLAMPEDHEDQVTIPADLDFVGRLDQAFRLPLSRIAANADTIGEQSTGPLRGDYAEYAGDIAMAARHLLAMIDDLADLQAIERPDFAASDEAVDLADLARRASALLGVRAANRRVRIDRPAEDEHLPARGEARRVLQILVNLIGNALRYSPDGGMIWIRTEREGDLAVIVVADQGRGIPADQHARIFEKFVRLDPSEPSGSGLGLYIARRLARAMGGDVTVDSAPGQGARFTLSLPADDDQRLSTGT